MKYVACKSLSGNFTMYRDGFVIGTVTYRADGPREGWTCVPNVAGRRPSRKAWVSAAAAATTYWGASAGRAVNRAGGE